MGRPKRKSAAPVKKNVEKNSESDYSGDGNGSEYSDEDKNPKKETETARYRMKKGDDEDFVRMCVEHFDDINPTITLKGTNVQKKQKKMDIIWEKITKQCNKDLNVSKCTHFIISIH